MSERVPQNPLRRKLEQARSKVTKESGQQKQSAQLQRKVVEATSRVLEQELRDRALLSEIETRLPLLTSDPTTLAELTVARFQLRRKVGDLSEADFKSEFSGYLDGLEANQPGIMEYLHERAGFKTVPVIVNNRRRGDRTVPVTRLGKIRDSIDSGNYTLPK